MKVWPLVPPDTLWALCAFGNIKHAFPTLTIISNKFCEEVVYLVSSYSTLQPTS